MAQQERRIDHSSEDDVDQLGRYLYFDPEQLLASNPAGQIVNPLSIKQMEGKFIPDLFDAPKVVRVALSGGGNIHLVVDGLNRLSYAAAHKDDTFPEKPDFKLNPIKVYDATKAYLQNPAVVRPNEHPTGLDALTIREYFRAVVPPTAVQVEIAPQRIAAHLIRSWEGMIGEDIAKKFSLLAALEHELSRQEPVFFASQTPQEADVVTRALGELGSLFTEHNLRVWDIRQEAYMLIANQSQIIGGAISTLKEIQGLMYHPEVERKLVAAFPDANGREEHRVRVGRNIVAWFRQQPDPFRSLNIATDVLLHKDLTVDEADDILHAANPKAAMDKVFQKKNYEYLLREFIRASKTDEVSGLAEQLVGFMGRTIRIEYDVPAAVTALQSAEVIGRLARSYYEELTTSGDQLIQSGVDPEKIDQYRKVISDAFNNLYGKRTPHTLKEVTEQLKQVMGQVKQDLRKQQCQHWVGNFVREQSGSTEAGLIHLLIRQLNLLNIPYETQGVQIKEVLAQLDSLDADLRHDVLFGLSRLAEAIKRQKSRRLTAASQVSQMPSLTQSSNTSVVETQKPVKTQLPPASEQAPTQSVVADADISFVTNQQEAERLRIKTNNEIISQLAQTTKTRIAGIDLNPSEYGPTTLKSLQDLVKFLGEKLVGHPDILRTHQEWKDYQEQEIQRRKAAIENDLEKAEHDTRTGR